jgi:hypothetical protein
VKPCELCAGPGPTTPVLIETTPTAVRKRLCYADLCAKCEAAAERSRGWQEREKAAREQRERELAEALVRNQTELF